MRVGGWSRPLRPRSTGGTFHFRTNSSSVFLRNPLHVLTFVRLRTAGDSCPEHPCSRNPELEFPRKRGLATIARLRGARMLAASDGK